LAAMASVLLILTSITTTVRVFLTHITGQSIRLAESYCADLAYHFPCYPKSVEPK
jgi:hypothetical protein